MHVIFQGSGTVRQAILKVLTSFLALELKSKECLDISNISFLLKFSRSISL